MKRKMIGAAAAYMAGLFFASFFTGIRSALILAAAALILFAAGRFRGLHRADFAVIGISFAAAFTVFSLYTTLYYSPVMSYEDTFGSFEGRVDDIRYYDGGMASYTLKGHINGTQPARVSLYCDELDAVYGDRVTVGSCKFTAPQDDYLFAAAAYYKSEGVYLSLSGARDISAEHTHTRRLKNALMEYRSRIISEFRIAMGTDIGDLLAGMTFGEKQGMDEGVKTSLYRSGIGHVLAVSGLHVSVIAAVLMWLLRRLRVNRFVSFALVNVMLMLLLIMANSPVSALRAAIMFDLLNLAGLFRRQNDTLNSLSAAVLLICLTDPYVIYSSGFLLSAAGTFGIAVYGPYMAEKLPDTDPLSRLLRSFVIMLCTMLCIMPLSMRYFDETSLISPLTNIIMLPFCSASMLIGILYIVTGGALSLLKLAYAMLNFVLYLADRLAWISAVYFSCSSGRIVYAAYLGAAAVMTVQLLFGKRVFTAAASSAACSLVFLSSAVYGRIMYDRFTVAVLGRDSNAAVAVSYKGVTDIIDLSGHYRSPEYVRKYLSENGITKVRQIILTDSVQSQYAAYAEELRYVDIAGHAASGDTEIFGSSTGTYFGDGGFVQADGSFTLDYGTGTLIVEYCGSDAVFTAAGTEAESDAAVRVYYGNIRKDTALTYGSDDIYLDKREDDNVISGINNFEITMYPGGGYRLRRL